MTLTFGSLFAGIGGFDLGLERAGMECLWQVEIDDYCQKILEKHWPDVVKYRDVYGVSGSTLETVDVICGGFPCQPVSLAGRRQGTDDERWLWPEFARLVGEIRPRYVIVENVPGLRTKGGYEVVTDLAEMGYHFEWGALSAEAVGAPHKRERFILVAYTESIRLQGSGDTRSSRKVGEEGQPPRSRSVGSDRDVADPDSERLEGRRGERELGEIEGQKPIGWRGQSEKMGDPTNSRRDDQQTSEPEKHKRVRKGKARRRSFAGGVFRPFRTQTWIPEPNVGRVVDGVPDRVERIRSLGNAIVPQVAEVVGRWVVEHDKEMTNAAT